METEKLSFEKSFELITQVIAQARGRFEENGFIYLFWGLLNALTSFGQFILLQKEYYAISWYPYLLTPIGGVFTIFYFAKKRGKSRPNLIGKIVSWVWLFLSVNIMVLGFMFYPTLEENLIPIILILLSVGIFISAIAIKSRLLLFSGILINLSAFVCFNIKGIYQPLLMSIISVVAVAIPGIILMIKNKQK
ncbi:MAG: hypothetical protein PHW91_05820 [Bacteroidales bacterium]|nr:hypothetical protein [Bacteroidales bacterium]